MRRQIADFLGELAEEMGWAPDMHERQQPLPPAEHTTPAAGPSVRFRDEALRTEVERLRGTVEHLSSEITNLRAEMARLRNLPLPPDAIGEAAERMNTEDAGSPLGMFSPEPRPSVTNKTP